MINGKRKMKMKTDPIKISMWMERRRMTLEEFCDENGVSTDDALHALCALMGAKCDVVLGRSRTIADDPSKTISNDLYTFRDLVDDRSPIIDDTITTSDELVEHDSSIEVLNEDGGLITEKPKRATRSRGTRELRYKSG